jgi:hypothetical protein
MRYLLALCFILSLGADQPVASYTRFCATCGIWGADTIVSQSGQFIVHRSGGPSFPPLVRVGDPPLIECEPQLVAVTAERTKRAFLEEIGVPDTFRDKIHVVLLNRARPEQPIELVSHIHSDGFQYQIGLPLYLESSRLIKAVVQGILQEYSNRGAARSAELPTWLVEGMLRQLLSSVVPAPVVNRKPLTVERIGYDRLGATRGFLQTNVPLTIQELSFNNLGALSSIEQQRYESSAHLLVSELFRLRGGPALMGRFLQSLPQALNWQTAFHKVYQRYFRTPLDLEKWWMLSSLEVRNRQAREIWATPVSLERLEWLLRTPIEFRVSTNVIPQKRDATLQEVLASTDFGVQKELLGQKLQQIFFLSANLSPEVLPLATAYEQAIDNYVQKRALNEYQPSLKADPEQRVQLLLKSTAKIFDELDQAREDIRAGRTVNLPQPPKQSIGRQVLISRGSSRK